MVAAALAGSLVTLLLEPARSAPTSTAAVPFRNAGRIAPAAGRSAVAGSAQTGAVAPQPGTVYVGPGQPGRAYIAPAQPGQAYVVPAPKRIYQQMQPAPGSAWFAGPPGQAMMPGCIGPGLRPRHIWISRPPTMKSLIGIAGHCAVRLGMVPLPIAKRLIAIPGRCAVPSKIGRLMLPKHIVITRPGRRLQVGIGRLRTSWRVVLIGPHGRRTIAIPAGALVCKKPLAPSCVILPQRPSGGQ